MTEKLCMACGKKFLGPLVSRFCSGRCLLEWIHSARGIETEVCGVVGLIAAVYAWRECLQWVRGVEMAAQAQRLLCGCEQCPGHPR